MNFVKSAIADYKVEGQFASGRKFSAKINKSRKSNPSARGGAYIFGWEAQFGTNKGFGETRIEAVEALVKSMARTGLTVTF